MKINSILLWMAIGSLLVLGGCSHTSFLESSELSEAVETDRSEEVDSDSLKEESETVVPEEDESIFVQVAGAVKKPGVYELPAKARVFEAVDAAGGFTAKADDRELNLALPLSDGEKIYVYKKGENGKDVVVGVGSGSGQGSTEIVSGSGQGNVEAASGNRINLNTADAAALQTLSGIGEAKAQAILSYREANGGFGSIEELKQVDGIGEATFQKLKEYITI
ncbi:MAG: helix-hairpin-helix domain-containing protein [Lachnospiraceae bacterium]|nr:helix-hairpin-helix domain-containing protein [Lachnospiraceae bacterium]